MSKEKPIVVGDFDEQWGKWLEELSRSMNRVADELSKIRQEGIIAYPSMKERTCERMERRR